ncbi:1,6-anhydro-N-acetylmuramyl-L-alanine amidase AmpD [Janthinobacterium sp. AD80]|uniref:1,6-anhydro-N-acetylmuramyl-L-alanine amidase AmpD n=1 Tax=unclassified Janthinobacterium TaxID=2610881 RepID=UPI000C8612CA|nr:1,6-anhydro-N-acetylmuramyl-L-alanine amidase AmpD [Janthinobacterium sp. AD80]PMQ17421.1 1,6-anhydro-N-acetylmuramyl-L-alanine amidase AmpD [Janthinobacterium sp. AD80]
MMAWTIDEDGWCDGAVRYESPYCDARPEGALVDLLVIHNISLPGGSFGGPHVSDLFTGRVDYNADPSFADLRGLQVSAHFFVRRDGALLQYVSADQRAWHAGTSSFQGRPQCNGYSIGIEMEGSDHVAFQPRQYRVLAALTAALAARYGLAEVRGHEHIAPGRKTDPGPFFDWNLYQEIWLESQRERAALALTTRVLGFPSMP